MIRFLLFFFIPVSLFARLVLNEVYCNVAGSDRTYSYLEFIEFFNNGNDTIDILNYRVTDLADTNDIIKLFPGRTNSMVLPGHYALLLDPDYPMEENPLSIPDSVVIITIANDKTIGNTLKSENDCVFLYLRNELIEQFCWDFDPGDGLSWEKINPYNNNFVNDNWGICKDINGCTPGRVNSIYSISRESSSIFNVENDIIVYKENKNLDIEVSSIDDKGIIRYAVFDIQGNLKGWINSGADVYNYYHIIWDGKINNKKLDNGLYLFHIEIMFLNKKYLIKKDICVTIIN